VIVRGTENAAADVEHLQRQAMYSTVHGAGRVMSRTKAAGKRNRRSGKVITPGVVSPEMMHGWMREKGVILRGGGLDESPHVYRRLPEVLAAQKGTIDVLHTLRHSCRHGGRGFVRSVRKSLRAARRPDRSASRQAGSHVVAAAFQHRWTNPGNRARIRRLGPGTRLLNTPSTNNAAKPPAATPARPHTIPVPASCGGSRGRAPSAMRMPSRVRSWINATTP
jgi:hypothetical protein